MRLILLLGLASSAWGQVVPDTQASCGGSTSTFTCSYTMSAAANGEIVVSAFSNNNSPTFISSVVWDVATANQSFTNVADFAFTDGGLALSGNLSVWVLAGPTTSGTKLITFNLLGGVKVEAVARSYTGVKQTGQPEANSGNLTPTCGNTNCNAAITTVANNAWIVMSLANLVNRTILCNQSGDNCTNPISEATNNRANSADLGPVTPAGASTITANANGAGTSVMGVYALSLAPAPAATPVKHKVTIE